jgi:hypothetical protein
MHNMMDTSLAEGEKIAWNIMEGQEIGTCAGTVDSRVYYR